jgi:hypothetical protein
MLIPVLGFVITDVNNQAREFAVGTGKTLGMVLYTRISRARHKCAVIRTDEPEQNRS